VEGGIESTKDVILTFKEWRKQIRGEPKDEMEKNIDN
jgi:hypothetical protein